MKVSHDILLGFVADLKYLKNRMDELEERLEKI